MLTFFSKTFTILYIVAIKKNFKLNIGAVLLVTINGSIIRVVLTQHSDSGVAWQCQTVDIAALCDSFSNVNKEHRDLWRHETNGTTRCAAFMFWETKFFVLPL